MILGPLRPVSQHRKLADQANVSGKLPKRRLIHQRGIWHMAVSVNQGEVPFWGPYMRDPIFLGP